jgi:polysaccharide biosynthesis/export protein
MMNLTYESLLLKSALLMGCLCIALSLAGGQSSLSHLSQNQTPQGRSKQLQSSTGPVSDTISAPPGDDYVIGPEDILEITVWKQPELSGRVPVRPDGKISRPLTGEVEAAGLTPPELADAVTDKLKKYLKMPQVSVVVQEVKSQFVNIAGEVVKPGRYELTQPMTIVDALTNAGGPTEFAKVKRIYVLRRQANGTLLTLFFDYKAVIRGKKLEENIYLRRGDTVVIP